MATEPEMCICVGRACGRAGDLVDGKVVAGTLEASLHKHVGGITVPVNGTAFKFVHAAGGTGDRGFIDGWKTESTCWAAQGEIAVPEIAKYGRGFGVA